MVPAALDAIDYPRTFEDFITRFDTEDACRAYLEAIRWRDGFVCPRCGVLGDFWRMNDGLLRCCACRARTSVTAGTVFDKTRYPLRTWFRAMWHITGQWNGASVRGLQRELGLGSYQTAWAWMHKLRLVMSNLGDDGAVAQSHGLLFYRLCEGAVVTEPAPSQRPAHVAGEGYAFLKKYRPVPTMRC